MDINLLDDWDKWKETLAKTVNVGEGVGFSGDTIDKAAFKVGNFLTSFVDPRNKEEHLLKELWEAADEEERKTLAKIIVKMVN